MNESGTRLKKIDSALKLPHEWAREMRLVDHVENREFLCELFDAMYDELPEAKLKKRK